jgi:hypothetical protein
LFSFFPVFAVKLSHFVTQEKYASTIKRPSLIEKNEKHVHFGNVELTIDQILDCKNGKEL